MTGDETTIADRTQAPPATSTLYRAGWTRFLRFWLKWLPAWLCEWLAGPVTMLFYLLAAPQRRAVVGNLAALRPEDGPLLHWWGGYRVFHQFALAYLDRIWHMQFGKEVIWEAPDDDHMRALQEEPGGALVFTVHAGNYDFGSAIFATKLGRDFHTVRVPEKDGKMQRLRRQELLGQEQAHPLLHIHYNENAGHLGVELCRLLESGRLVAVQGDRVVMEVSPMETEHDGLRIRMPRGPIVLAHLTCVPCYPVFVTREGRLHYRVVVCPPFIFRGEAVPMDEIVQRWLTVMMAFVRQHWEQWFVFEPVFERLG